MTDQTPGLGHNDPPPFDADVLAECQRKAADFNEAAKAWLDLGEISSADQAKKATDFVTGARVTWKQIEDARKAAKAPHDEAAKAVQDAFSPLLKNIKDMVEGIAKMQAAWIDKDNARIAKEKREAAERARKEREEAEKRLAEAEKSNDIAAKNEAEKSINDAKKAEKRAEKVDSVKVESASGGGRSMSLRTTYECEILNINHAFVAFRDHPEVAALLIRLANAEVRSQNGEKTAPHGFTLKANKKAA